MKTVKEVLREELIKELSNVPGWHAKDVSGKATNIAKDFPEDFGCNQYPEAVYISWFDYFTNRKTTKIKTDIWLKNI